jgi:uncharacterized SAM-binding protein YcdF (DUF218 family)
MNHNKSNHRFKFLKNYVPSKIKLANWRFVAIVVATLVGVMVGIYLYPAVIFYPMGRLLLRNNHPADGADFIVLLMGEASLRPSAAAKAVLAGTSNHILFVSTQTNPLVDAGLIPSEDDLARAMLKRGGLDASHVTMISEFGRATSTVDEALAIKKYFHTMHLTPKRLVVVTSWPHSSRAGWIIEKVLRQDSGQNSREKFSADDVVIELLPVMEIPFEPSNWWHSENGLLFIFEEYIKWGRYLIKYLGRDFN